MLDKLRLMLFPAYGRSYKDAEQCIADWQEGKDFKILGGPYCSIRDIDKIKADGFEQIVFILNVNTDLMHYLDI